MQILEELGQGMQTKERCKPYQSPRPIDEWSEHDFKLVGLGKHNVSYNTTGNNSIIFHLGVNENSKTNSNPKKKKE